MKKRFALVLASALLAFALTACGEDTRNEAVIDGTDNAVTDQNQNDSMMDGSSQQDTGSELKNEAQDLGDDLKNGAADLGDDLKDGAEDLVDGTEDALTGEDHTSNTSTKKKGSSIDSSYSQMLENARVHDTDGDLTDHENASTPGTTF